MKKKQRIRLLQDTCSYPTLTRKGTLYVSDSQIYFNSNKGERVSLEFKHIFSIRKAKLGFLDNAIEFFVRVGTEDSKILYKFVNFENRNAVFNQLTQLHEEVQAKLDKPSVFIINDPTIDFNDPNFEEEFQKIRDAICSGSYDCVIEDEAVLFTALFCQVTFGDYNPTKHKTGFLAKNATKNKLVPQEWKSKIPEEKVLAQYQALSGSADTNIKSYIIKRSREIAKKMMSAYGLKVFFVREIHDKKVKPRILGISREAILRMDIDNLEVIYQNGLEQMKRYLYRDDVLSLDFGVFEKDYYHVYTKEGEEIAKTLTEVIAKTMSGSL